MTPPTVSEPIRDDEPVEHPFDLVPCEYCVHGTITVSRWGRDVKRKCRECKGTPGFVLRGEPTDAENALVLDFTAGGSA